MKTEILRLPKVESATGLKRSTIYEMIADGEFPRQIKLGKRAVGWKSTDIEKWIKSRHKSGHFSTN